MTSSFDRWEKDPFFSAAEEVQESADRMESLYRNWMHERKELRSDFDGEDDNLADELRRELRTALGTAKWQLEEFDLASRANDEGSPLDDDARIRHTQFVSAIGNQILIVENSLRESEMEKGEMDLPWVRFNEGERDELVAFLSGPSFSENCSGASSGTSDGVKRGRHLVEGLKKPPRPAELSSWESKEETSRGYGHRRTASAGDEIGSWAINMADKEFPTKCLDEKPPPPLPKVLSLSGLNGAMESTSKMNWAKNGLCKWRASDSQHESELLPLQNHHGLDLCYERSKSCVSCCNDDTYDKHIHGWFGAVQRQLQRSQYQIQYGRPIQVIFWVFTALLLIVLFILRAI